MEQALQSAVVLDSVYADEAITIRNGREASQPIQHRVGDYFDRVCVLPNAKGNSPSVRLFFQCKADANRLWKDVMAFVLKQAKQSDVAASIAIDYRVDEEETAAVAAQIPNWFSHLGDKSRQFWELSATYLLKHPVFTFEDLARDGQVSVGSLRAMHRNSYRAIWQEQAPDPLWSRPDHLLNRNVYTMDSVVRDEILCLTINDAPIQRPRIVA